MLLSNAGITKTLLFIMLLLIYPSIVVSCDWKPFTTDGCSSFPDGTGKQQSLWVNCCIQHDLSYWKGGDYDERLKADKTLQSCVAKVGKPDIAGILFAGVRVGGSPYFRTPYRWGYGWRYLRGSTTLSIDDTKDVKDNLEKFTIMINSLSAELK